MQDCIEVPGDFPIRQGDVLKKCGTGKYAELFVVVTADCDIAQNKIGAAGLVCVSLVSLAAHVVGEYAEAHAKRQIRKRTEKLVEWINQKWMLCDTDNVLLSYESAVNWIVADPIESIEKRLCLPSGEKKSFLRREIEILSSAELALKRSERYAAIDALCVLSSKTRSEQLKSLFSQLDPADLPMDMFFVSGIPGEPGVGFIARLKSVSFLPPKLSFTSFVEARDHDTAYVRVGRLESTFRHALAQQFGMLFSRIGLPAAYEADRDTVFEIVFEQIVAEMENNHG